MNADEYIGINRASGKISKLDPFKDDILKLKKLMYSNKQIQEFLNINNISVSQNAIRMFVEKNQSDDEMPIKKQNAFNSNDQKSTKSKSSTFVLPFGDAVIESKREIY